MIIKTKRGVFMNKKTLHSFLFYLLSAPAIGGLSALITGNFSDFFLKYEKPPLQPPNIVFPIVWTVLYLLMGYSAYLISKSDKTEKEKGMALKIYWAQLFVNFLWSIVFFRFELLWGGVVVIALLLALLVAMLIVFSKICPKCALLNIPYLLWVIFATYLTVATAVIN